MERFRVYGDKIVARVVVTDCPRRQHAGDVDAGSFLDRFKSMVDEILASLRSRPQTAALDNRRQHDGLRRLNERNAEFWKGRVQ